jgi:E3 ubiquitin-protein ligase DOA10
MQVGDGCILTMSSVEGDSWLGTPIVRDPALCYIPVTDTTFYCKYIDEKRLLLKCTIHADPLMTYIPSSLINFALKNCCWVFLNLVENNSKNLDPVYE